MKKSIKELYPKKDFDREYVYHIKKRSFGKYQFNCSFMKSMALSRLFIAQLC